MSRKFLTPIDLTKNELQNARIQNLSIAPSSPVTGQIYYDTVLNGLYVYNGTAWATAGGIQYGALSSRPSATIVAAGTFYYATDNYLMYYSNGTTWQQVNSFGPGTPYAISIAGTGNGGSSTNYSRDDHQHAGPGFGSVTTQNTYGGLSANGSATTVARSDHAHGTPSLSSNAASNISATSATNGSGTAPAKDDHVHGFTPSGFALSAFGAPTADTSIGGYKLTNVATPTATTDAANKSYVDAVAQGLNVHDQVQVATTANLTGWTYTAGTTGADGGTGVGAILTNGTTGTSAIDGYTLALNDRVLVKNQTTQTQNGIYYVSTAGTTGVSTVLTRATDANNSIAGQITAGDFVFVVGVSGTTSQTSQGWSQTLQGTATTPPRGIKIGTDNIAYSQFSGAGTYTASNGVTLTGSNFTFNPLTNGGLQTASGGASILLAATNPGLSTTSGLAVGAGTGITVSGSTVAVDTTVVARKYATNVGDGTSTTIMVTHSLGTRDVHVTVYDASSYAVVNCDIVNSGTSSLNLSFSTAPTTNQYRVVVVG